MVTIQIADNVSNAAFARVQALADRTLTNDANWNGAQINVVRGDFTCMEGGDEIVMASLMPQVYRAIDGEPLQEEDYPWDDTHVARIKTHD
jgi:hypothetical protein